MEGFDAISSPSDGLNVWRVVSGGIKNNGQQEKQYDVTAKCIILSSLSDNVFDRVFSCENAKKLWQTIIENHEGTKNVANERYHVLIDKLNSFNNLIMRMPNLCTHD